MVQLWTLLKREWWEHRALRILPLGLMAATLSFSLLALALPGRINENLRGPDPMHIRVDGQDSTLTQLIPGMERSGVRVDLGEVTVGNLLHFFGQLPKAVRGQMLMAGMMVGGRMTMLPLGLLAALLSLGVLRAENLNRSSTFFKSMPVSEAQTLLAKFLLNGPLALLVIFVTVATVQVIPLVVMTPAAWAAGIGAWDLLWAPVPFMRLWSGTLISLGVDFLYFLPAMGLLAALNAWHSSRRLLAAALIFTLGVLDNFYLSGGAFFQWCGRHMIPPGWALRGQDHEVLYEVAVWSGASGLDFWDVGLGLLLGLAGFLAAARLLRWREER